MDFRAANAQLAGRVLAISTARQRVILENSSHLVALGKAEDDSIEWRVYIPSQMNNCRSLHGPLAIFLSETCYLVHSIICHEIDAVGWDSCP